MRGVRSPNGLHLRFSLRVNALCPPVEEGGHEFRGEDALHKPGERQSRACQGEGCIQEVIRGPHSVGSGVQPPGVANIEQDGGTADSGDYQGERHELTPQYSRTLIASPIGKKRPENHNREDHSNKKHGNHRWLWKKLDCSNRRRVAGRCQALFGNSKKSQLGAGER